MKDDSHGNMSTLRSEGSADILRLARSAIAILSAYCPGGSACAIETLEELFTAVLAQDESARQDVILRLTREGVPVDDIIDYVLPSVARVLGDRWATDRVTFADVTTGTARLQDSVRQLGWHSRSRPFLPVDAPAILLVIPKTEEHTLGAFVLADQWRRTGRWVDLAIHSSAREVAPMLRTRTYAMVGITAAGRRTLAPARELVETVRRTGAQATPVFMGGAILDQDIDVLAETGADHVARTAGSAMRKCGISDARWTASSIVNAGQVGARHDGQ